jgi:tetratricopeptide (TPR) repeat protein
VVPRNVDSLASTAGSIQGNCPVYDNSKVQPGEPTTDRPRKWAGDYARSPAFFWSITGLNKCNVTPRGVHEIRQQPQAPKLRRASAGSPGLVSSRAKKLARSGQSGAAIKLLEAGLEEHPTNVFFLNQAAYLYKRTGNSVKAIEYLERSRRINPRDMFTINTLGNLYAGQGRAADAERVLTEGRRIDPNNMFIITTLGTSILISNAC